MIICIRVNDNGNTVPKKVVLITISTPLSEQHGQQALTTLSVKPISRILPFHICTLEASPSFNNVSALLLLFFFPPQSSPDGGERGQNFFKLSLVMSLAQTKFFNLTKL